MSPGEYDRFRQQVDEQLRANLAVLYEAYLVTVRACETLALASGAIETGQRPPLQLSLLPGAAEPARLPPVAEPAALLPPPPPSAAAAPDPAPPPAAQPVEAPAAPGPPKRMAAFELHGIVHDALPKLGEVFSREDLVRVLPSPPKRSTLLRVLDDLIREDRVLELARRGTSGGPSLYRSASRPPPPTPPQTARAPLPAERRPGPAPEEPQGSVSGGISTKPRITPPLGPPGSPAPTASPASASPAPPPGSLTTPFRPTPTIQPASLMP